MLYGHTKALLPPHMHTSPPLMQEFFDGFVNTNLPCVITGACDAKSFPPLANFKDDGYLRQRAGHRRVNVKGWCELHLPNMATLTHPTAPLGMTTSWWEASAFFSTTRIGRCHCGSTWTPSAAPPTAR